MAFRKIVNRRTQSEKKREEVPKIMNEKLEKSYKILESLRQENGLYLASSSSFYSYVWLRDSFYEVLPYIDKDCDTYEKTYWAILDILKHYSWKIKIHTTQKPQHIHEYIHPRYSSDGREIDMEWGNAQHDAIGAILFGIGRGEEFGKKIIRDQEDLDLVQDLVWYLDTCEYWRDPDNGMWEENREVHASSVGACVAGMYAVQDLVSVSYTNIRKGLKALEDIYPRESETKAVDLAQLSLVYPYCVLSKTDAEYLVKKIEKNLLRKNGVIRYAGDSYYYSMFEDNRGREKEYYLGKEAEWTFGLPWLSLCYMQFGDYETAKKYLDWTESVMLENGNLPELYYAGTDVANPNTPLGWSNAMYILAKEKFDAKPF